jgi:hypothetical protein
VEPGDLARADVLNHMGSGTGNAIILVCQLGSIFFSPSFSFIHFTLSCDKSDRADFLNHMGSGSGNDTILVCRVGSIFFSPSFSFIQFTLSCDKSDRISGSLSVTSMQLDILEQMCVAYPYLI